MRIRFQVEFHTLGFHRQSCMLAFNSHSSNSGHVLARTDLKLKTKTGPSAQCLYSAQ